MESFERGEELLLDRDRRRELERGRDDVVRRLAAVDVVIRVDAPAAETVRGQMGDDLVHVGVGRGARAGLVDVDREVVVVAALGDLGRGSGDRFGNRPLEEAELGVRLGRSLFDLGERRRKRRGKRWPEIGKLRTARWVEAPYRASAGTSSSPMESFSTRVRAYRSSGRCYSRRRSLRAAAGVCRRYQPPWSWRRTDPDSGAVPTGVLLRPDFRAFRPPDPT